MTSLKWVLLCVFCVCLGQMALAADDDANLSPQQKKRLKELKKSLVAMTQNDDPAATEAKEQAFRDELKNTLSLTSQPSEKSTDGLASSLIGGLASGKVTPQDTMQLSKEISVLFEKQNISDDDVKGFVKTIEPVVNGTGLTSADRNKLYNQILTVVNSAQRNGKNR
jgi:hypothetical protein